jgi:hypothetical protein
MRLSEINGRQHTCVHRRNRHNSLSDRRSRLHVGGGDSSRWLILRTVETSETITDEKNNATQEGVGEVSSLVEVENLSYLSGIHARGGAEVILSPPLLGVREDTVFVELCDGIEDLLEESAALQKEVALREVAKQKCIFFFSSGASVCGASRKLVEIDVAAHFATFFPEMFDERPHVGIRILAQNDRSVMRYHVWDMLFNYFC